MLFESDTESSCSDTDSVDIIDSLIGAVEENHVKKAKTTKKWSFNDDILLAESVGKYGRN
jgi:hypothetical protein